MFCQGNSSSIRQMHATLICNPRTGGERAQSTSSHQLDVKWEVRLLDTLVSWHRFARELIFFSSRCATAKSSRQGINKKCRTPSGCKLVCASPRRLLEQSCSADPVEHLVKEHASATRCGELNPGRRNGGRGQCLHGLCSTVQFLAWEHRARAVGCPEPTRFGC